MVCERIDEGMPIASALCDVLQSVQWNETKGSGVIGAGGHVEHVIVQDGFEKPNMTKVGQMLRRYEK